MHVYTYRAELPIIFVPPPPVPRTHEYWGGYIVASNYYGGAAHAYQEYSDGVGPSPKGGGRSRLGPPLNPPLLVNRW